MTFQFRCTEIPRKDARRERKNSQAIEKAVVSNGQIMSLALAAFLALLGVQEPAATGTGSIEGTVTRAGTSQPIENAVVAVWGDRGPDFRATTDANGHFV